jgi:Mn2+/Fe2+ NRAMP family transporter
MGRAHSHQSGRPLLAARIAVQRAPRKPPGKGLWAALGPGLITGASDDDPSGIMAMTPKVMGQFTLSRGLCAVGWLCTAVMAVAVGIMFATS